jgi:hypothetical protein
MDHPHLELFSHRDFNAARRENLWTKLNGKIVVNGLVRLNVEIIYVSSHSASNCKALEFAQKFNKKG